MGVFGDKLRQHREQRGLELEAISNTTKISPRMLRALEDEHFDQLPGGVFNKGFVRAYARQVGLDEEEAVADYLVALRENQIQQQSALPDFRAPLATSPASAPTAKNLSTRSVDAGFHSSQEHAQPGAAALTETDLPKTDLLETVSSKINPDAGTSSNGHRDESDLPANRARRRSEYPRYPSGDSFASQPISFESSTQVPWRKLAAGLFAILLVLAFWNLRRHAHPPLASTAAALSTSTPVPAFVPPAPPPTISANPATVGQPNNKTNTKKEESSAPAIAPSVKPPSKPAAVHSVSAKPASILHPPAAKLTPLPKAPKTFTLLIRADKTTWVSITADGKPIADETLIAPAHTSVRAAQEIIVKTRNASGISFALNGREFPVSRGSGEVRTYVFTSFGYHLQP